MGSAHAGVAAAPVPGWRLQLARSCHREQCPEAGVPACAPLSSGAAAHRRHGLLWHQQLLHQSAAGQEVCAALQSGEDPVPRLLFSCLTELYSSAVVPWQVLAVSNACSSLG